MYALKGRDLEIETATDLAMFQIIDALIDKGEVNNLQDFCSKIDMFKQAITEIKKGTRHFNVKQIQETCKIFNVNANFIFGFSTTKFRRS